ncbi:SDR family oxidoreductase [Entomospira entomophila]|uniref:SDR family oxidoreductase n=1 Tax=Entomospira entomophila TaxID=2719988 RepID=A0A968KTU7_9SPIO|nr:SDR family oxidoreductase [Entomospira entomophilus]NIZ40726.1 SDR family oxidoreductase [Entomospira entomophilus]WDI34939.1 SDR family oxidoreductase [Entomospira entomophilus]
MLPTYINLKDKVIVVTGGTGILCGAMVREIARQGAKVVILSIDKEPLAQMEQELKALNQQVMALYCNVLEEESVRQAKEAINANWGEVDVLINGAGGNHPKATTSVDTFKPEQLGDKESKSFFDMELKGFQFVFDLNFMGTFIPSQIFASDLVKKPHRQIINISSMSSHYPLTRVPAYSAAKAAVNSLTMWMAVHFADVGLRVNAMAPGFFITDQNRALLTHPDGSFTERSHKILTHTPLKRFGTPEDLLGPLLWLLDEQSSGFISGHILPIDGGFMAYAGV